MINGSFKTIKMLKDINKDVDSEKDKSKEL
jgi:hypothetical protein